MEETFREKKKDKDEQRASREQESLWLRLFCPEHRCSIRDFTDLP